MTFRSLILALLLTSGPALAETVSPPAQPALWRVADADTTIFLFGTVHALPEGTKWLQGALAGALLSSDTLVTEILPGMLTDPAFLKASALRSRNPDGVTLRSLMTPEQRARYEEGLAKSGIDPAALDGYRPWFAANALVLAPLVKKGYTSGTGSESVIDARVPKSVKRIGLETVEAQLAMFDTLPLDVQIANLLQVVTEMTTIGDKMDRTLAAWLTGDVAAIGAISEDAATDPRMAQALLHSRNEQWADWVAKRLAQPGRVFVAVGAGHLAGAQSVQNALAKRGLAVTRLQ